MKKLSQYDEVNFYLGGNVYRYKVDDCHLRSIDTVNDAIFFAIQDALKGKYDFDKMKFCRASYGYAPGNGSFPTCSYQDYDALARVVESIHTLCSILTAHAPDEGDQVSFTIKGKTLEYTVCRRYLENNSGGNEAIFEEMDKVGIPFRINKELKDAYGYEPNEGCFPEYDEDDYKAVGRAIVAIKLAIFMATEPYSDGTRTHKNKTSSIKFGDRVIFQIKDETFAYKVMSNFMSLTDCSNSDYFGDNDAIFRALGISKYEFLTKAYGYKTTSGDWPSCKTGDYAALRQAVNELFAMCEEINSEYKSIKSESHEVRRQSKTESIISGGEAIRPRRKTSKIASSSRLIGHAVTAITRRGKVGGVKIKTTFIVASRG